MRHFREHLIKKGTIIKDALKIMDKLAQDAFVFVVDENDKLLGSLTDGDVRRGLIRGLDIFQTVDHIIQRNPRYLRKKDPDIKDIVFLRENFFKLVPILDENDTVINVINFGEIRSYLPIDVVFMAGGRGARLRPLTDATPKPLLRVGDKCILEHNLDRLIYFGIDDFWITVNYLGQQIEDYFGNGAGKNYLIEYVWEEEALGTIGSLSKIKNFRHNHILVSNSDLLTNLNYEDFFLHFLSVNADLAVVAIPYKVDIPYGVMELINGQVMNFKEKPSYTYFSNGGIYLMKREVVDLIPKNKYFNATDLMESLIRSGKKVISYPLNGYWLDIGKHEDYKKAHEDIKLINFK
jgi:dTDP-glucose pyrophosphorylase